MSPGIYDYCGQMTTSNARVLTGIEPEILVIFEKNSYISCPKFVGLTQENLNTMERTIRAIAGSFILFRLALG